MYAAAHTTVSNLVWSPCTQLCWMQNIHSYYWIFKTLMNSYIILPRKGSFLGYDANAGSPVGERLTTSIFIIVQSVRDCAPGCKFPWWLTFPSTRLRLHKPAVFFTGKGCFWVKKVRNALRIGVLFKCSNTRAMHNDILSILQSDALQLWSALIARRGMPLQLLLDQGTMFYRPQSDYRLAIRPSSHRLSFLNLSGIWER